MSGERIIHGILGALLIIIYLYVQRTKIPRLQQIAIVAAAMLGTWVPDWDLFIGIGFHRSPLTHSIIPSILVGCLAMKIRQLALFIGFALGSASHLLWDIVDYGDVRWIPGGNNDRLFLLVNAMILIAAVEVVGRYIFTSGKWERNELS